MVKKFDVKIFMGLHILGLPEYEEVVFGTLSVSLYLCVCTLLAHGWMDFFHIQYSIIIGLCLVNINIPVPKLRGLQMGSKIQNGVFLEQAKIILIAFGNLWRPYP
jgi:hypothetical protein